MAALARSARQADRRRCCSFFPFASTLCPGRYIEGPSPYLRFYVHSCTVLESLPYLWRKAWRPSRRSPPTLAWWLSGRAGQMAVGARTVRTRPGRGDAFVLPNIRVRGRYRALSPAHLSLDTHTHTTLTDQYFIFTYCTYVV